MTAAGRHEAPRPPPAAARPCRTRLRRAHRRARRRSPAALVVAQALLLAHALGRAVHDGADLARDRARSSAGSRSSWRCARSRPAAQERYAHRAATRAVAELREGVVAHAAALGPRWLGDRRGPGRRDAGDPRARRARAVLRPLPAAARPRRDASPRRRCSSILGLDWVSAAILVAVLPLVPIFMWLVGRLTQGRSERGPGGDAAARRPGARPARRAADAARVRPRARSRPRACSALGDAHRRATMGTLRIAFLSGMVLELLTTLSVALVAVGIGLRLVEGDLDLVTGLAVLVLAPEVFNPLRQVGAQFHASSDGVAAAEPAFAVLETPAARRRHPPAPDLSRSRRPAPRRDRPTAAAAARPTASTSTCAPGAWSRSPARPGAGKSTTVEVLLGLLAPDEGTVELVGPDGSTPLADVDARRVLAPGLLAAAAPGAGAGHAAGGRGRRRRGRARRSRRADRARRGRWPTSPTGGTPSAGRARAVGRAAPARRAHPRAAVPRAARRARRADRAPRRRRRARRARHGARPCAPTGRTVLLVAHRASLLACADDVVTVAAPCAERDALRR